MGMYDSVFIYCPECYTSVEFQSKASDCSLAEYSQESVPIEIARDIFGQTRKCSKCGFTVKAIIDPDDINRVRMRGE